MASAMLPVSTTAEEKPSTVGAVCPKKRCAAIRYRLPSSTSKTTASSSIRHIHRITVSAFLAFIRAALFSA